MKHIISLLLMLLALTPCQATNINVKREHTSEHGGMRMPSFQRIGADYENGDITVKVSGYTGNVQVIIYNTNGDIVGNAISFVSDNDDIIMSFGDQGEGEYTLCIVLDNATYSGEFQT